MFVTNAVLCNPKDARGNNSSPSPKEMENCVGHLRRQIDLVDPPLVVTLGAFALRAMSLIERHGLALADAVRSANKWYGRVLIPLYHPGQRAMIHRSFSNQQSDYQFVAEQARRIGFPPRKIRSRTSVNVSNIAGAIVMSWPGVSYFGLHKLFYLFELAHVRAHGTQLTDAFFIRQKDGPYCVDLHLAKLRKALPALVVGRGNELWMNEKFNGDLFGHPDLSADEKTSALRDKVDEIVDKYRADAPDLETGKANGKGPL